MPLKIATLESCKNLAAEANDHIVQFKRNGIEELIRRKGDLHYRSYDMDSYLSHCSRPRFGTGEGKAVINKSVGDTDVFVMVDVTNYSIPYTVSGYTNHMSPDDHFQDLKQIIEACSTTAHRVNMVMLFLYESRQHKCSKRESLDCAMALEGLTASGVENTITFDTYDPRVQNAIPLIGSDNFMSTYQSVKAPSSHDPNIRADRKHLIVINPDEDVMNRAVYPTSNLDVDMSMSYKRRGYSRVIGGRSPIVAHEFPGSSAEGKTAFIIDGMMSLGESMPDTCKELKEYKADKVIICCIFGFFVNGPEELGEYCHQGYLDYVITTSLNYRTQELIDREWCLEADTSEYLVAIVNSTSHDRPISASLSPMGKVQRSVQKCQNDGYEYFQKFV